MTTPHGPRPIRIAAQLHPQQGDYPAFRAAVRRSEKLGYDIVYTWDHFFPLYGDPGGGHLECWTLLAAAAETTSRIELGPLVSCTSYRNANLIADMARTIDRISGGRFILGLGSGWFQRDYDAYGYPFGSAGDRLRVLEAALATIGDRLERLAPPPQRPLPILIAGAGVLRTLRLVATYADSWHAGFPDHPDEIAPKVEALERWCAQVGRDPGAIERGVGVEPDDLDRFLAVDAERYVEMGFSQFTLGFNGPSWSVEAGRRWLAWRDTR
jgi:probable F420-dependent oxidoreductase